MLARLRAYLQDPNLWSGRALQGMTARHVSTVPSTVARLKQVGDMIVLRARVQGDQSAVRPSDRSG